MDNLSGGYFACSVSSGCVQLCRQRCERGGWSVPAQLIDIFEKREIASKRCQFAKEKRKIPIL